MKIEATNLIRSRGISVLVLGFFGGFWLISGLFERQIATAFSVSALAMGILVYVLAAIWLISAARRGPKPAEDQPATAFSCASMSSPGQRPWLQIWCCTG
jgi:hypothetical protein